MNKLKEISVFVIFGLILFSVHSITSKEKSSKKGIEISLPNTTQQYTRIESVQLLKKIVFNELFVSKDKAVFEKIKSLAENSTDNESSIADFNINLSAPIELINLNCKNKSYSILRIASTRKGINGKVKIPYFETEKEKLFILEGDLKQINALENEFSKNKSFNYHLKSKSDIAILSFAQKKIVQTSLVSIQKQQLKIKVSNNSTSKNTPYKLLSEKGFHFSFPVSEGIQIDEQLKQIPILPRINFPFKDIRHISCNYYGFKFTENDSIIGLPKIDLLMRFSHKTQVDSLLTDLISQLKISFPKNNQQFTMGKEKLLFTQIDSNTIYLSTLHARPKLIPSFHPIKLSGDLNQLTQLENAGWKGMLIEVIPLFKSTKKLLQKTEKVTYKKVNESTYEMIIPVKKNENLFHELMKFALSTSV
jgi:hypothetical protein